MNTDRSWMYQRFFDGYLSEEFITGVNHFIIFAKEHSTRRDGENLKCPCAHKKCKNKVFLDVDTIKYHLYLNGFEENYYTWIYHGENPPLRTNTSFPDVSQGGVGPSHTARQEESLSNRFMNMVQDVAGPDFEMGSNDPEEPPNAAAQMFYDMLQAGKRPVYPGCKTHTQLALVSRMMNLKIENNISQKCYDQFAELIKDLVPDENLVPDNFYTSKKLLRGIGLPVEKIDCCKNNCMLYWGDGDSEMTTCKVCNEPRYKPTRKGNVKRQKTPVAYKKMYYFPLAPRLQRLYASDATAKDMRWHAEHVIKDGMMNHPSDSEAWKHFSHTHPEFASESRNVRLGLCTDGFQPYGCFAQPYSSWPVILTPYNLPPSMCMKPQFMFLTVLVPGPANPKEKLDVFLQPLIAELNWLWSVGAPTYDCSKKQNFQLHAALMWTISDFPAYSMLSGWSTAGRMACPHCMERSDAFHLRLSRKMSWFDNHRKFLELDHKFRHDRKNFRKRVRVQDPPPSVRSGAEILAEIDRLGFVKVTELGAHVINKKKAKKVGWRKRSIFWDLPYWSTNLIRHNLDVMHIEKNVFDNIFNTVMSVKGKMKDTYHSRDELNDYCDRPKYAPDEEGRMPFVPYALSKPAKVVVCEWVKGIQFPDNYASKLSRCVDKKGLKLINMKSHDCHVFMQRLMPIAFRELLPKRVWKPIVELSLFFRELTSTVVQVEDMSRLDHDIPLILCQLETIFPPSLFDSMEHLPVHLAYEARLAGPVQYRWMYPFERYLRTLKCKVTNKARVEGSIANSYLVEETSTFSSYYFDDKISTRRTTLSRNEVGQNNDLDESLPVVFLKYGQPMGKEGKRLLDDREYSAARIYVLLNCDEVQEYISLYKNDIKCLQPTMTDDVINKKTETEFPDWFKEYVRDPSRNVTDVNIRILAEGPSRCVKTYTGCKINGYRFQTISVGSNKATLNSGVCVKGSEDDSTSEYDYYGRLIDIVELDYRWREERSILLFKCDWFDPTPMGTKVHPQYKFVDVNHKRKLASYEPFVIAEQVVQVCYLPYPSLKKDNDDWWAACKVRARSNVTFIEPLEDNSFQDDNVNRRNPIDVDDIETQLDERIVNIVEEHEDEMDNVVDEDEEEFLTEEDTEDEIDENFHTESNDNSDD